MQTQIENEMETVSGAELFKALDAGKSLSAVQEARRIAAVPPGRVPSLLARARAKLAELAGLQQQAEAEVAAGTEVMLEHERIEGRAAKLRAEIATAEGQLGDLRSALSDLDQVLANRLIGSELEGVPVRRIVGHGADAAGAEWLAARIERWLADNRPVAAAADKALADFRKKHGIKPG